MASESTPSAEHLINGSNENAEGDPAANSSQLRARCDLLGIPWHDRPAKSEEGVAEMIDPEVAVRLRIVPLRLDGEHLVLAMIDPLDTEAADEVATLTGNPVLREGMEQKHFSELMREHYGTTASKMADALAGSSDDSEEDLEHNLEAIDFNKGCYLGQEIVAPAASYFPGFFKKSTTSISSFLASSQPATSSNVTLMDSVSTMLF